MKAQFVFENIKFERSGSPRGKMGIGGVNLAWELDKVNQEAKQKWNIFLQQFVGKTITGPMDQWDYDRGDWKDHTVKVAEIEDRFFNSEITVTDPDGNKYTLLSRHKEFIIENVKFERTGNARKGLDIGGVSLSRTRKDFIDQSKRNWADWIEKHLIGKTITAKMNQIQKMVAGGYEFGGGEWGEYTVKVEDYQGGLNMDDPAMMIVGDDQWIYALPIDDNKIWIK